MPFIANPPPLSTCQIISPTLKATAVGGVYETWWLQDEKMKEGWEKQNLGSFRLRMAIGGKRVARRRKAM